MERTFVKELNPEMDGKKVMLSGWVQEIRDLKKIKFIVLRDFSGLAQLVALSDVLDRESFERISKITPESVISVVGTVKKSSIAKMGIEISIEKIEILAKSDALPILVTEKDIETGFAKRFDYRSVDLRKQKNLAIFKIESALIEGMTEYLSKSGFLHVFTPCIMGAASESGAEVFKIAYYGKEAYLRQDPQLHRQLTIAGGIEKIYDLGPNWRAEKSHTARHLCEHRACAVEIAFIKDEIDIERLEERVIVHAIKNAVEKCADSLALLGISLSVPKTPFPEIRFPEVYDILASLGKKLPKGTDFDSESMELLAKYVKEKYNSDFYWVNRFPFEIKPFYVMRVDSEPEWARSIDLNYGALEMSSGGQRENRYENLMKQVNEKNLNPENLEWFTKFFKYGVPPHGGFAVGIERLTQALLKLPNIREAVLFPREPDRILP
ncbi:MAG: aspartate--tRNA(Asn) ligase [Candidatus Woesearchaeota archaeon]|nr:aspartate--tRNA(Asn) ligase [Candidatus Woesearchaeota archaeon]